MAQQPYLVRRGQTYYFRQRIPVDLVRHYDGRTEIRKSLKTTDRAEARTHAYGLAHHYGEEFARLRNAQHRAASIAPSLVLHALDERTITRLTNLWTTSCLEGDEQFYLEVAEHLDESEFVAREQEQKAVLEEMQQALARGRTALIRPVLGVFLDMAGIVVDADEISQQRLERAFLKATAALTQVRLRRMRGEVVDTADVVGAGEILRLSELSPKHYRTASEAPGPSFEDLFEAWRLAVLGRAEKGVRDMRAGIQGFRTLIGQERMPASIVRGDIERFRDHLLHEKNLSWKTVSKRVGQVKSLFTRAVKSGLLSENPGIYVEVPKPRNRQPARVAYEVADLQKIFGSPLYQGGKLSRGGCGEAARWLPLLALYTGARIEELAQLRVEDVRQEQGIDYLDITDAGPHQKLKNEQSRRRIPIHPALKRAGFLRYVATVRADADRLFPLLKQDSKGDWSANWGKWYSRYVRREVGITDRTKVFHSFRHGFKSACRRAGLGEEIHDALTGHSGGGVGRSYGELPLEALDQAMRRVEFLGVQIPVIVAPVDTYCDPSS